MPRVIIFSPGWNCEKFIWAHMNSVFEQRQHYEYTMDIIVDDGSTDKTGEQLEMCKQEWQKIYHNNENLGWLHNSELYLSPEVNDDDIIIWLDLDDWFIDSLAIKKIVDVYEKTDCWTTYGKYKRNDGDKVEQHGYSMKVMQDRSYRQNSWYWQHPRTFRGFLWNAIDKQQFKDPNTNKYIKTAGDLVIGFAILEMCPVSKIHWFSDDFIMYNRLTGNNDDIKDKASQIKYDHYFRTLPKYNILKKG